MSCYISSNNQRLYAAVESNLGDAAAITSVNRFPAVKFGAVQQAERLTRRDKTGSRTFRGFPFELRRKTTFDVTTYLSSWTETSAPPSYGALFEGALGSSVTLFPGDETGAGSTAQTIQFSGPHGLSIGQGLAFGGEIRFVAAAPSSSSVVLNQPFSVVPTAGSFLGATASYRPANELPSISLYDFWSPASALQRFVCGGGVDRMRITLNGDFHEFEFSGGARDLVDNASFQSGMAALTSFPAEPALADFDYSIVPGHLGQAWLGTIPSRFYTLTAAEVVVENGLDFRDREFGGAQGGCLIAGERRVTVSFSLFEQDNDATRALYQAARQRSPISVMFQLGQQPGQLCGIWLTSVVPEVPEFDDSETRLQWRFDSARAHGSAEDEIFIAFG